MLAVSASHLSCSRALGRVVLGLRASKPTDDRSRLGSGSGSHTIQGWLAPFRVSGFGLDTSKDCCLLLSGLWLQARCGSET